MKFLIVDDHAVVREGLAAMLRQTDVGSEILQADGLATAVEVAAAHPDLDLALLDLSMPGTAGVDAIGMFGDRFPSLPVIIFSASEDVADVGRAIAAGALGYIPKSAGPSTLAAAINLVLAGEIYVPPLVVREHGPVETGADGGVDALTDRQRAVFELIGAGLSNKEIARRLNLSEKTVKAHGSAIYRVLNVRGRAMAARIARNAT